MLCCHRDSPTLATGVSGHVLMIRLANNGVGWMEEALIPQRGVTQTGKQIGL